LTENLAILSLQDVPWSGNIITQPASQPASQPTSQPASQPATQPGTLIVVKKSNISTTTVRIFLKFLTEAQGNKPK
jgi:hypothetical protein